MIIKGLRDEDFLQYKLPSMFVIFPSCSFKCERECGLKNICQNSSVAKAPDITISASDIVARYLKNDITKALVCGGLEPFDSFKSLIQLLHEFRKYSYDPFIIYTGYYKDEIDIENLIMIKNYPNVIIKWGRFKPNQNPHYDKVLGVELASSNQFADVLS